jgi:hypothetical protein
LEQRAKPFGDLRAAEQFRKHFFGTLLFGANPSTRLGAVLVF